jgi:predicted metal-dependent phosphoesterase TrpH
VVAAAAAAGVETLALSDHDSVEGVEEAAAAAGEAGIKLVPAVEISAIDEGRQDLHILGYMIDHRDRSLSARLERYRAERRERADAMAQALGELGFQLDDALLRVRAAQGESIGRPHLAQAVVNHSANAARLAAEGCTDASSFLERYLIEGRPAFRPRLRPSVPESIAAIHEAGGVAVWAHPFWDISNSKAVIESIDRFRSCGLDGVECFYVTHSQQQVELLTDRCEELELLSTGSSDFHGPAHRQFSRFRAFSTYGRNPRLGPIAR